VGAVRLIVFVVIVIVGPPALDSATNLSWDNAKTL
jgi:hypothetical protein